MSERCEYCWAKFHSHKYLEHHHNVAKYCHNYKYVLFTCRKCNFSTRGIKNIDTHMKNCKSLTASEEDPVEQLHKRIRELEETIVSYKTKLVAATTSLEAEERLSTRLTLERLKNKIFRHIIEQNTSIRVDDVLVEEEDGIHVYNTQGGCIPIFVHEHVKSDDNVTVHQLMSVKKTNPKDTVKHDTPKKVSAAKQPLEKKPDVKNYDKKVRIITDETTHMDKQVDPEPAEEHKKPRKQSYRSVKSSLELIPETSEEDLSMHIDLIDAEIEDKIDEFGNLSEAYEAFDKAFSTLRQSRIYTKILDDLRAQRWNIFGRISFSAYQSLIQEHIRAIETIFREKKYSEKKSTSIISKGLSPLESRLVNYGNYTTSHLEIDEIQRLETVLDLSVNRVKEYAQYNIETLCNNFYNYGVVLLPFRKNLTRYLFNRYGFNNIIYLPLPKNSEEDPFSFYILERVNKDKRYWKMDCRLEDIGTNIITRILPYLISMFRKLYHDVFGDNEFRPNYEKKTQLTECDCEQLLQNIILLGQPKKFCNIIRTLVYNKARYCPTENDKFNLYGDDALQRKRFQEREAIELVEIVKQLFDGITAEEAVDFYRSRVDQTEPEIVE